MEQKDCRGPVAIGMAAGAILLLVILALCGVFNEKSSSKQDEPKPGTYEFETESVAKGATPEKRNAARAEIERRDDWTKRRIEAMVAEALYDHNFDPHKGLCATLAQEEPRALVRKTMLGFLDQSYPSEVRTNAVAWLAAHSNEAMEAWRDGVKEGFKSLYERTERANRKAESATGDAKAAKETAGEALEKATKADEAAKGAKKTADNALKKASEKLKFEIELDGVIEPVGQPQAKPPATRTSSLSPDKRAEFEGRIATNAGRLKWHRDKLADALAADNKGDAWLCQAGIDQINKENENLEKLLTK